MSSPPIRHLPDVPFPPYAYVPGKQPHPTSDPRGHSFGKPVEKSAPVDPDRPRDSTAFLHGLDLFQHGYYWEAHEAWEGLWHAAGRQGTTADLLKGLIALAAAGVKAREGNAAGVKHHASRARDLFRSVENRIEEDTPTHLGLSPAELIGAAERIVEHPVTDDEAASGGRPVFDFELRLDDASAGRPPSSGRLCEWRLADGVTLDEHSRRSPVLVVCLRHGGCPFCRRTLSELAEQRAALEAAEIAPVLVHLMTDAEAQALFEPYGLDDLPRIADPEGRLYEALGLRRGSTWEVMGPPAWWQGLRAVLAGYRPGIPRGDVFRMPGAFLLSDGKVVREMSDGTTASRPDFAALANEHSSGRLRSDP